jgi:hypothetical protein
MTDALTGHAVVRQAADSSLPNTEPVALTQTIMQIVGVVVAVLVFKGYLEPNEGAFITAQSLVLIGAIISLAAFIGAALGRARAYAPKTAAVIAVANAAAPAGSPPSLAPPPLIR